MENSSFDVLDPVSRAIWEMKYRFRMAGSETCENAIEETWDRVAHAVAAVEKPGVRAAWSAAFRRILADFRFLPAGRILAGAGTGRQVTLFNCFVMGRIPDSLEGIFTQLKEAALTMQQGGGIGHDFSTIRPRGAAVKSVAADASGPLSFMDVWDAMCRTIMSAGTRRGAMMATMRCDHPDIESFISAKRAQGRLRNFNLSVLVTDRFMAAVKADESWPLVFEGQTFRTVSARGLWDQLMRATFECAEPGVIFIDRINAANNLAYCETISCTNPCGEQPLPPYGACLLGSLNLTRFVANPFGADAGIDRQALADTAAIAVRFMDNVIDVSNYPLPQQRAEAFSKRRIGLGITGLADALAMCGLVYGSPQAAAAAREWMSVIEQSAYGTSVDLARERGAFPSYDAEGFLRSGHAAGLPRFMRGEIGRFGIRNGLLTSIAPAGTISLLAGNVSSGIEPIFSIRQERRILESDGSARTVQVTDYAAAVWWRMHGRERPLPPAFVTAETLKPSAHLAMQAAVQEHVDSSISKTINVPASISFDDFKTVYEEAYDLGLKGCTTFRPNRITGSVLSTSLAGPGGRLSAQADDAILEEDVLGGQLYQLEWPGTADTLFITINDTIKDGVRRPVEIFINSGNTEHYGWCAALTRVISAVFRRGGDVSYVVRELKAVIDPRGGQWINGCYLPSLPAAIGDVIERHMLDIGFMEREPGREFSIVERDGERRITCPRCGGQSLMFQEGCATCLSCGFARCG